MQRLEVSGEVRPIYGSLGVKRLTRSCNLTAQYGLLSWTCIITTGQYNGVRGRSVLPVWRYSGVTESCPTSVTFIHFGKAISERSSNADGEDRWKALWLWQWNSERSAQSLLSHDHSRGAAPAAGCRPRRQLGPWGTGLELRTADRRTAWCL